MRDGKNKRIFAFITNRCNNACKYCFVYDEDCKPRDMTLPEFESLCKEGADYEYITFIGGEPLLHPELYELMQTALSYNFKISISTSGITNINDQIKLIFSLPIDDVTLSLDSHNESTNDFLRGNGAYSRIINTCFFLKERNIQFRVTATICNENKNDIIQLADLVLQLGALQLDIHVMSQKGRATGKYDMSISPKEWLNIRKELEQVKYPYPFTISYPLMWYSGNEYDNLCTYCDAQQGNRLSVLSNCECFFCTIAIGFNEYMSMLNDNPVRNGPIKYCKNDNMCDVEKMISTCDDGYRYLCRFVKRRTGFLDVK